MIVPTKPSSLETSIIAWADPGTTWTTTTAPLPTTSSLSTRRRVIPGMVGVSSLMSDGSTMLELRLPATPFIPYKCPAHVSRRGVPANPTLTSRRRSVPRSALTQTPTHLSLSITPSSNGGAVWPSRPLPGSRGAAFPREACLLPLGHGSSSSRMTRSPSAGMTPRRWWWGSSVHLLPFVPGQFQCQPPFQPDARLLTDGSGLVGWLAPPDVLVPSCSACSFLLMVVVGTTLMVLVCLVLVCLYRTEG